MNLGKSTFQLVLSKTGNAALLFGGITLFARWLPQDDLGTFFLYLAVLGLLSIPADFGVRGALEKRLSQGDDPEATLGSAMAFKLITLGLVLTVLFLSSRQVDAFFGMEVTPFVVVGLVAREFSRFYVQAVRGELRVGKTAPIEFSRRLVWVSLGSLLVMYGYGVLGLIIAHICGLVVEFAWAFRWCNVGVGRPSMARLESLVAYSKYETITAVGGRIYQWLDLVVIGYFLLPRHVGAYEIAWQVTLLIIMVSKSLELTLFPQFSRWDAEASIPLIESTINRALGYALYVSIPATVGAALYSEEILHYVFGPEYVIASTVLLILMVEKVFQSFNDIVGSSVRAIDKPALAAKATTVSVVLNLVLNPILVLGVGIAGAAVATTVSWFVNALLHNRYLSRYVEFQIPYRLLGWYAVSSLVMGAILFGIKQTVPVTGIVSLILQIGFGVVIYFFVTGISPDVRDHIIVPGFRVLR